MASDKMTPEGMRWYAVSTKNHQESTVRMALERAGVEVFFPQVKESRLVRRQWRTVTDPLFPGYLFARYRISEHHRTVCYARGVRRVVSFGQEPAVVEETIIDAIRGRIDEAGFFSCCHSSLKPGQIVQIEGGVLHGLEAIFEKQLTGSQRAVLLLRAMSYQARVVVGLGQVANL